MWSIRVMSGRQTGTIYDLKPGKNIFGRGEACHFQIQSPGASKQHFEIHFAGDKLVLTDLKSSNGTFVNGIKIRNVLLRNRDKILVHDVLFEITNQAASKNLPANVHPFSAGPLSGPTSQQAPDIAASQMGGAVGSGHSSMVTHQTAIQKIESYMDDVVLPGVYQLPKTFEIRSIVLGFAVVYVVIVTLLSILPMKQITAESVETESRRRAQTLARALASSNERMVRGGDVSGYSTDLVLREEGIDDVFIVSREGTIIAPPERAGNTPKESGYVQEIRRQNRDFSKKLGSGKVAASTPILVFDPELQQNVAKAHAVVIYNPGSLTFDDERALSLFIQTLALASAAGLVLFYFLFKAIEYPVVHLRKELDRVLREGGSHLTSPMKFGALQELLVSLNSLLSRSQVGAPSVGFQKSSEFELRNLLSLMGYPALLLNKSKMIVGMNRQFEMLTGYSESQLLNQNLAAVPDQAFQKNVESLLLQAASNSQMVHKDQLEISGHNFFLNCQSFPSADGDMDFFVISLSPFEAAGGAA